MALYRRYVGSILVSVHFREVGAANLIKSFRSSLHDEYLHPGHAYVASVITHTHTQPVWILLPLLYHHRNWRAKDHVM